MFKETFLQDVLTHAHKIKKNDETTHFLSCVSDIASGNFGKRRFDFELANKMLGEAWEHGLDDKTYEESVHHLQTWIDEFVKTNVTK